MDFQTPSYTVDQLIRWIDTGRLALPEFQREFVWPPTKVVDLLDSVARGWPIGSVLILEGPQPFRPKRIDQSPPLGNDVRYFVLDGQQRITALYHAVADVSDVCYFVDFSALASGDRDSYFTWEKRRSRSPQQNLLASRALAYRAFVSEVFHAEKFHAWQAELSAERAAEATALRERFLAGLKSQVYKVPAIQLDSEIELEALARIFEAVNRGGMRLNAFDLMVAVLYPHGFNLRDEWDRACDTHDEFVRFQTDGLELLKLIALFEHFRQVQESEKITVRGVRQGDVLNVSPQAVRRYWERAVGAYSMALRYVAGRLGSRTKDLLPSESMLLPLAIAISTGTHTQDIASWYWSAVAEQSFAQGANTRVLSDAAILLSGDLAFIAPNTGDLSLSLRESVRRNQVLHRGVCSLIVSAGGLDPVTNESLDTIRDFTSFSIPTLRLPKVDLGLSFEICDTIVCSQESLRRLNAVSPSERMTLMSEDGLGSQEAAKLEVEEWTDVYRDRRVRRLVASFSHEASFR
jgi:hypothetical protein